MLTKLYDFTNPDLYSFDDDLIDFTESQKPRLKLLDNPGQDFIENFTNSTGHVFDSNVSEFSGGRWQQKNIRPLGAIFYASYEVDENANWSDDSGIGTLNNGAVINANGLDVSVGATASCSYNGNVPKTSGCIRLINVKFNDSSTGYVFSTGLAQELYIYRSSASNLRCTIKNNTGAVAIDFSASALTLTPGTPYEIELNWDQTTGVAYLFIDGILKGSDLTWNGDRAGSSDNQLFVGSYSSSIAGFNGSIGSVVIFNTLQHSSNYTPGESIPDYEYADAYDTLPEMEYTGAGTLIDFDALTYTKLGSLKIALQIGQSGVYTYWNGSAWVTGDGTKDFMSTIEDFAANVATLDIEGEIYGQFRIFLPESNTQGYIDILTASLTAQTYSIVNPSIIFSEKLGIEGLLAFAATITKIGNDEIEFILSKNGTKYYWNGLAWVTSNGSYPQSSTAAEIEANKASFTEDGIEFGIEMILHSDDGTTTPECSLVSVGYDFYGGNIDAPHKTVVFGVCYDETGSVLPNVTITASLERDKVLYNSELILFDIPDVTDISDDNGYWELNLIDTVNMDGSRWVFTFSYNNSSISYTRKVPEQDTVNFASLIS